MDILKSAAGSGRFEHARRTPLALAAAALMGAAMAPSQAAIVSLGDINVDPSSGNVGQLYVGTAAPGAVTVNGGSSLTAERLVLAGQKTGNGSVTVDGAGSAMTVSFGSNGGNVDVGGEGAGSLSVLRGASFVYGGQGTACQTNCRIFVSNAAGSQGNLRVDGTGSTLSTVGGIVVGNASVFTAVPGDPTFTFNYGTAGASVTANATVAAGGSITSSSLGVGQPGGGNARTGTETSTGTVLVDGTQSVWNLVRNSTQLAGQALLRIATGANTTGSVEVKNGGTVRLDGSIAADQFTGINVAAAANGATMNNAVGSLTVSGDGSRVTIDNGIGFANVGRGFGTNGSITVRDGATLGGQGGEAGLVYMNVGQGGGTGQLNVTGNGSELRLSGRNSTTNIDPTSVPGGGAFLSLGRGAAGAAGQGTANITGGGHLVIDTSALALTNVNGQTGMYVGAFSGSTGTMTVSGAGSSVQVMGGSGMAPYVAIGRDSGTGTLNITAGGRVELTSSHVSVPNLGSNVYLPGDVLLMDIGRRVDTGVTAASTGTVTVSGVGSQLVLGGAADSLLVVGRGLNGNGTLNVVSGGALNARSMLVGQEAGSTGTVNINGGQVVLDGVLNGGPSSGQGVGLAVGRGGTGTINIGNGSTVTISSTAPRAGLSLAASTTAPGGVGTANVSGGSTVSITGPEARVAVGRAAGATGSGIGTLNILGSGSGVSAQGAGAAVLIGGAANTVGMVNVGAGASLSATDTIGVAHDENGSTEGLGTLVVNGTVTTGTLTIGTHGLLGGSGEINADVVNFGTINPGNSPGTLTINGDFDNTGGLLVVEIQSLGNGQYAYDQLLFGPGSNVLMGDGSVRFSFVDDTNPLEFLNSGLFDLGTFFKRVDGNGAVEDLDEAQPGLFTQTRFEARSDSFVISRFEFDPQGGVTLDASRVPLPASLPLVLLGLGVMGLRRARRGAELAPAG